MRARTAALAAGSVLAALLGSGVMALPAAATSCPPATVGGPAVGWITVDGDRVPIKTVTYPAGGQLDPPASALVAGVSKRHKPLLAASGTTVLTWHVRYGKGCEGALNGLMTAPIGTSFTVEKAGGEAKTYAITDRTTVPKGDYQAEWFSQEGDPRIALFTCTGLKKGRFTKTMAIFAEPTAG